MSSGVTEYNEQKNDPRRDDPMDSNASVSSTFSAFNLREDMKGKYKK